MLHLRMQGANVAVDTAQCTIDWWLISDHMLSFGQNARRIILFYLTQGYIDGVVLEEYSSP